jgi:PelA/Pel-15E family pectate lyase
MRRFLPSLVLFAVCIAGTHRSQAADPALKSAAEAALKKAATYYHDKVALHGGYVYYYSPDLSKRLGEGVAAPDQVWVQPPGTPTVGMAYLAAYQATKEPFYLDAARDTAKALVYGQLASGGWANSISFDPKSRSAGQYRNGRGRGRNHSTLDDGITSSALECLLRTDRALEGKDPEIRDAVKVALDALLAAQFPNGGFPQVWTGPVKAVAPAKAKFPDYDWRTENRIKEYWDLYTLNDDILVFTADTLAEAADFYNDERCRKALVKLGDFLIDAQLPEPQPAWAQQYDYEMRPVWARKFEPPAVSGRESQGAIRVLMKVYERTGDAKYLEPIPRALAWLDKSRLADGRLARYYELQSNKPLYMSRQGEKYSLTHDDSDLPDHYGWKTVDETAELRRLYEALRSSGKPAEPAQLPLPTEVEIRTIIAALDAQGRWISRYGGEMVVGQPKFKPGEEYIASAHFAENVEKLARYLVAP